jgi:phage-related tail protein
LLAGATLAIGDFFGLFDLDGDSPLSAARAGMLTLLAAFQTLVGYITGDFEGAKNALKEAFEELGMKEDEAAQLAQKIVDDWKQIPTQIAEGLDNLGQNITNSFTDAWEQLKTWWDEKIPDAKQWGSDLIQNLIDGIKAKYAELRNAVSEAANIISDYLHHTTPETGPLKDDDKWGIHFVDNWIGGVKSKLPELQSTHKKIASMIYRSTPTTAPVSAITSQNYTHTYGDIHINVIGNGFNEQQLAQHIARILKKQQFR